ncbi:hypothetical protein Tco_0798520 [Tanacetum coccineum]
MYENHFHGPINLAAAVFVAVSILKASKTEDLSRNCHTVRVIATVNIKFLLLAVIVPAGYIISPGRVT